ncbi:putative amino acid permease [Hortaea werneckii]|nr:putative amino acid permease [Hortaea werneckii]KAI7301358.1 putative amino acid permease [Hortaea werneckii]
MASDLRRKLSDGSAAEYVEHHHLEKPSEGGALEGVLGYKGELTRNRSLFTLLFQSLAIAAVPYGEGGPLLSAIYGGGQLSIFIGWIVANLLTECTAVSLGELASRYPTSGGPSYWTFQVAGQDAKATLAAFITGWVFLIGNWTITLSVNFGFAGLLSGTIAMYYGDFTLNAWQLLLIFWALCVLSMLICTFGNRWLPLVDSELLVNLEEDFADNVEALCAAWTLLSIVVILIALSVKADAGRHSPSYSLGHYDTSLSGWAGFTFLQAEECADPVVKVPNALALSVPTGTIAGLFFVVPICVTLPPLAEILEAPNGQALPYVFKTVMGGPSAALGLMVLVLVVTLFCSISITNAASRTTWAFARDHGIPGARLWAKVNQRCNVPVNALVLVTLVQMLLGLINLGSTSAFTAFVSVGVQALALSYAIPIAISLCTGRREVNQAKWTLGAYVGPVVNAMALAWISFEMVLFSMPTALPVTAASMNYASVVLVGFGAIAAMSYIIYLRKVYNGPPTSEGM